MKTIKPICLAISALFLSNSIYAIGFAPVPFQVLNVSQGTAPPNVLFVIDNSGSMWSIPENGGICATLADAKGAGLAYNATGSNLSIANGNPICRTGNQANTCASGSNATNSALPTCQSATPMSRIDMVRQQINTLVNNPLYANFNWGIGYLNQNSNQLSLRANPIQVGPNNGANVLNSIGTGSMVGNGVSATLAPNGVIASQGTPFTSAYYNLVNTNFLGQNSAIQYRCQKNFVIALTDGAANGTLPNITNTWRNTVNVNGNNVSYANWSSSSGFNGNFGLGYLSAQFANADLKTTADGLDADGMSWNDSRFNNGQQNLSTFTINFGQTNVPAVVNYLTNGAQGPGSAYFPVGNQAQLTAAFARACSHLALHQIKIQASRSMAL